jgi:NitT/TauT family transport system substrate-binding protein
LPQWASSQALEKPNVTIAVGGKNLLYYLPLTIAEQLGYFKAEGLDVTIVDFAGGSKALQAVVGGSADVASGAFEHTINMQFKGQFLRAFVLQGATLQIVLGINPKTLPNFKTVADLKGKKIGVSAPGSSTNVMVNFLLAKVGLKPTDVSIIGVGTGTGSGAVAAMRSDQIDAMSNLDPVITLLLRSGDLKIASDTRVMAESEKVFGGPMPAGCLYAPQPFIDKNQATIQALTNAMLRANKWCGRVRQCSGAYRLRQEHFTERGRRTAASQRRLRACVWPGIDRHKPSRWLYVSGRKSDALAHGPRQRGCRVAISRRSECT